MALNPLAAGIIAVSIAFATVISFGFWIHAQPNVHVSDNVFAGGSILAIVLISFGLQWALMGFPVRLPMGRGYGGFQRLHGSPPHPKSNVLADFRARRRAELERDPAKHGYIPLLEKGDYWSDEQIAYKDDRTILATCRHLQPIESAMRTSGIGTRRLAGSISSNLAPRADVRASCRVEIATLRQKFPLPSCVTHDQGYHFDRYESDNPWAHLYCKQCNSSIELAHPDEIKFPIFPP